MRTASRLVRLDVLFVLAIAALAAGPAAPRAPRFSTHVFQFRLSGNQVVPLVNTDGTGSCTVTLDDQTGAYTVTGDYACLSGDATDVHFHAPAPAGQQAPVVAAFSHTGGLAGTFSHSGVLTPQQVQDMLNGLFYVQLHSLFRFTGELRGQVVPCSTAAVSVRNGTGVNPLILSSAVAPVLGTTWSADLDCAGHAPGSAILFAYARPGQGSIVGAGEILVRTAGKQLFRTAKPHAGGVVSFGAAVPGDSSLCGLEAHVQGLVLGSPGPQLSNGLRLVLGQ